MTAKFLGSWLIAVHVRRQASSSKSGDQALINFKTLHSNLIFAIENYVAKPPTPNFQYCIVQKFDGGKL